MKLANRVQVEQLDDERWTNIERSVVSRASDAAVRTASVRTSRWGMALAFGGAMLVVVIAAGLIGWQVRGGGSTTTVVEAAPLAVDTTEQASTISIGDAAIVSDPATAFVVTRPDGGVLITMARGRVELDVEKRGNRAPLVVRAGDTDVIVVGTRFSVDYGDGKHGVDVRVTEGVVKVVRAQQETRVAANQAWSTDGGLVALADAKPRRPTTQPSTQPTGPTGQPSTGTDDTTVSQLDPTKSTTSDYAIETGTDPDVLRDRHGMVPDAKLSTRGLAARDDNGNSGSASRPKAIAGGPELRTRPGAKADAEPSFDPKSQIRKVAVAPPLDIGDIHPNDAISKYRTILSTERGERAAKALYSIAHLQHFKLMRHSDALTTLDQYVRRFAGVNKATYSDALWLRVRILCLQTIDDRCRQAAYTYVHQTDNAEVRKVAELIVIQR